MTKHEDVTGKELIGIYRSSVDGGLSLTSLTAVENHLQFEHNLLATDPEAYITLVVERARHYAAILKGRVEVPDLVLNIPKNKKPHANVKTD